MNLINYYVTILRKTKLHGKEKFNFMITECSICIYLESEHGRLRAFLKHLAELVVAKK